MRHDNSSFTRPTKPPSLVVDLRPARTLHDQLNALLGQREVLQIGDDTTEAGLADRIVLVRASVLDRMARCCSVDVLFDAVDSMDEADTVDPPAAAR
jgi:hypothetical protein